MAALRWPVDRMRAGSAQPGVDEGERESFTQTRPIQILFLCRRFSVCTGAAVALSLWGMHLPLLQLLRLLIRAGPRFATGSLLIRTSARLRALLFTARAAMA